MSIALKILLFPFKIIATIILFILKLTANLLSFLVFGGSLPFIKLADIIGGLIGLIDTVGLAAMLLCWHFGDLDGITVLIASITLGILSALFLAAEDIAMFIEDILDSAADFFVELIENMWIY